MVIVFGKTMRNKYTLIKLMTSLSLICGYMVGNISRAELQNDHTKTNVSVDTDAADNKKAEDYSNAQSYKSQVKVYMIMGFDKKLMAKATIGDKGGFILSVGDILPTGEKVIKISYDEVILEKNKKISKISPTANPVKIPVYPRKVKKQDTTNKSNSNDNSKSNEVSDKKQDKKEDIKIEDIALPSYMPIPGGTTNNLVNPADALKTHEDSK